MKSILLSLLAAVSFAASAAAQSLVPAKINYQAYVTDNGGTPYGNSAPENFDVTFRIYNDATTPAIVWAEKQTVTIHQGRFSVLLGNGVADGTNLRPALDTLFGAAPGTTVNGRQLSIGITVNTLGSNSAVEFSPRQQLVSNPLALRAASAALADAVAGNSINSAAIANGTITGADLTNATITTTQLADNSVTNAKMADNAVGNAEMADNAVGNAEMADNAIGNAEMADNAVTNSKLADNAVGTAELVNGAVSSAKIASDTITSGNIASGAIATAELSDSAVTAAKLASDSSGLAKVTAGRLSLGSANAALVMDVSTNPDNNWDIRLEDSDTGTTSAMRINAQNFFEMTNAAGSDGNLAAGATGYARLDNTGAWTRVSDRRLKRDISPLKGLLDKALALQPVTYHFKTETDEADRHMGFIAQEVREIVPSLVTTGDTLTLDYAGMSTVAIGAIKEQHAIVMDQDGRIEALEKENADLKARLERLEKALGTVK